MQSIERSPGVQSNTLNNQPCFYENNKAQNQQLPSHQLKNSNYYSGTKRRDTNRMYQAANIAEHSNLHATATEFVPNKNKQDCESHSNISKNSKSKSKNNFHNKDADQTSNNIFFEDNKVRYNDRKFENKRDAGMRWRENTQSNQFNNDNKDYGRNQNFRRYQNNDKYNQNKNFSDKSKNNRFKKNDTENMSSESNVNSVENEEEKSYNDCQDSSNSNLVSSFETDSVKSAASVTTKNSKAFSNNKRNDRHYDRKEKYNPKDPRDRKSNYSDYNSYSRNNYSRGDNEYNRSNFNKDDNGHNRSNYNKDDGHNRSNYSRDDSGHNRNNYNRNDSGHSRNDYSKDDSGSNRNNHNKFEKRENRNFAENRCKDVIDWRQKSNTTDNKNSLQKRPYHRKYEPGDYRLLFIKKN